MTATRVRLTKVQRDVLTRLGDGWIIIGSWGSGWVLYHSGEPKRHVAMQTMYALTERHLICHDGSSWELNHGERP